MDQYDVFVTPAPPVSLTTAESHTSTASPTPVLTDPEVTRLQRVLEDVRFSLERGCWQAALGAVRAALACNGKTGCNP